MKVVILQDILRGGGTERQSIRLTKALRQNGVDAQLLIGSTGGVLDTVAKSELGEAAHYCSRRPLQMFPQTLYQLRSEPADRIICMGRWAHYVGALLPGKNVKLIATVRTSRTLPFLYRRCIRKASHLIANSEWALKYTTRQIPPGQLPQASVVYNELARPELLEIDETTKAHARIGHKLPTDTKILLNVARFSKGKGQNDLVRMMAQPAKQKRQLWLVGSGPEKESVKALTAQLNLTNQVRYFDFTEDLRPLFACADIFVSASTLDSFPNSILEAQAAGLPVVAYPTAGVPELLEPEATGLLTSSTTAESLNQKVTRLIEDPDLLKQFGINARKRVIENFTNGKQESHFLEIIKSL